MGFWDYLTGKDQADAARTAANDAQAAGDESATLIGQAGDAARAQMLAGRDQANAFYGQALGNAQGYQDSLAGYLEPERAAGADAMNALGLAATGDASGLGMDPSYQFRLQEANRALSHQARATGQFGGGGYIRQLMRMNQQLASDEYSNAVQRLMGLGQQGLGANLAYGQAQLGAGQMIQGIYGAQANLLGESGRQLATLGQNAAAAQANAWNTSAGQVNNYNTNRGNALQRPYELGGALIDTGLNIGLIAGSGSGSSVPTETEQLSDVSGLLEFGRQ